MKCSAVWQLFLWYYPECNNCRLAVEAVDVYYACHSRTLLKQTSSYERTKSIFFCLNQPISAHEYLFADLVKHYANWKCYKVASALFTLAAQRVSESWQMWGKRFVLQLMANLSRQGRVGPASSRLCVPKRRKGIWCEQTDCVMMTKQLVSPNSWSRNWGLNSDRCRNQSKHSAETKWEQAASCNIQFPYSSLFSGVSSFFCCSGA